MFQTFTGAILVALPILAFGQGLDRRVTIENQTGFDVTGVFASARNSQQWGPNRVSSNLRSGYQIDIDLSDGSGSCNLEVLVVRADRRQMRETYDVCATTRIVVEKSNSSDIPVKFTNRTADVIRYIYVGGDGSWGNDLLGAGISLATDGSHKRIVRSRSGCLFNVRAVYYDNSELVMRNVNLCRNVEVEIANPKR